MLNNLVMDQNTKITIEGKRVYILKVLLNYLLHLNLSILIFSFIKEVKYYSLITNC